MSVLLRFSVVVLLFSPGFLFANDQAKTIPAVWTVQKAVQFALVNSPDTGLARQRINSAAAQIDRAHTAHYPQLILGAEYSQTDNPMYSFGNILNQGAFTPDIDFNDPGRTDNLNLQARLQYRLYNGGKDQAGIEAAQAGEHASRFALAAVHSELAFQVVRSFHTLIQAEETVEARRSAVEAIEASCNVARARFNAGDLLQTELLNLEVQYSTAEEQLIGAKHNLDLAQRGFLNLLGLEQGTVSIDPITEIDQELPGSNHSARRPEMEKIEADIQAAEAMLRQAEGGYYPTVDGFAGYQVDKGWEMDGDGNSWMAGVKVNYDLFQLQRTGAAGAKAMADLALLREQKRKINLGIDYEIEQARLSVEQAGQRLQVTDKMVDQAMESARLSRERFKEGLLLSSEVIDVENRLTNALLRNTLAKSSKRIAVADLRRAMGLPQFPGTNDHMGTVTTKE